MEINNQVIKRYLDGESTEQDKAQIIDWFNHYDAEKKLREESMQYWESVSDEISGEEYDESLVLGRIYREIRMREEPGREKPKTLTRVINIVAKVAAVLFIPLLILYTTKNDGRKFTGQEISYTEIYSPLGSRTMLYLPDGSRGWLNGGSYLKYAEGFPGKTRNVYLKGEAFFDVVTNPKKPFVVTGKNLDIVAKGTTFNVRAWEDMHETEIVLAEGKLEIFQQYNGSQMFITTLNPGELLFRVPEATGSYIQKVDVYKYISWTEGKLIFREDPFTDVVKRINRWYNVNIVIKDEILETYRYVATFQDETLDEVLKMLAISAPICYKDIPRKQLADGTFEKRTIELYYNPPKKRKN